MIPADSWEPSERWSSKGCRNPYAPGGYEPPDDCPVHLVRLGECECRPDLAEQLATVFDLGPIIKTSTEYSRRRRGTAPLPVRTRSERLHDAELHS